MKMRSKVNGILKGASALALGLMFVLPTTALAQYGGNQRRDDRQDLREERREDRRDRRERRRDERRGRDWGNNGNWGGSQQLRQTALNAGYNNGIKAGRNDERKGRNFNFTDENDYRNASKDYSSRLGSKSLYQRYFRQGFENGYSDGYNGY
jgi:hypothetical protein